MRVRDLQQILEKFTNGQKGTMISDCPIYIETQTGHLEDLRKIEVQESVIVGDANPARLVFKPDEKDYLDHLHINRVNIPLGHGAKASGGPVYIELVKYPDVFLRSKSNDVEFPLDDKNQRLIKWMYKAMYQHHGIGLAAIQVGYQRRIFVMDCSRSRENPTSIY